MGIIYTLLNYSKTKISGEPVYIIMPWDNLETLIFVVSNFVGLFIFFVIAYLFNRSNAKLHIE